MRAKTVTAMVILVLAGVGTLPASAQVVSRDVRVEGLIEAVSAERLEALAERLASFQTRHTLSTPTQTDQGIGAARQWILEEMRSYSPRLQVSFDTYQVPAAGRITRDVELRNVMAVLPGRSERRVYVSGHYDTVVLRPPSEEAELAATNDNFAPGANDDGSGTALTMELARVFAQSGVEFDATLVFIALAGEEMGLVGARVHAQQAAADSVRIDAVLNNDIIGNSRGGNGTLDAASLRVFSEGPEDSPSRQVARYVKRIASVYVPGHQVRLIAREDRFGRGGDHTAFNQNGFAGVRISESKENYTRQHTVLDTPDGMDFEYLAKNARVNAAAAAGIALAPVQPEVLRGRNPMLGRGEGYDAQLRWQASPGAVGYRIFWREAWGQDWQHELYVGDVTDFTLEGVSIDDYVFGVAAVGPDGMESLISTYVRPPRANVPVRTGG
jgi:hypothetical protein